jgi:hypothetical protein
MALNIIKNIKKGVEETFRTPKDKALGALSRMKDKVVDVTSDVISGPKRLSQGMKEDTANAQADNHRFVRENKGKPDAGDASDPLFRARVAAIHDTFDREEAKKKQESALQRQVGGVSGKAAAAEKTAAPAVKKEVPKLLRSLKPQK